MYFGFNNQFIKANRTLTKISKTKKKLFCVVLVSGIMNLYVKYIPDIKRVVLVSGIMNLYVKCIPDIKRVFSFDNIEQLSFYPLR